MEKAAHIQMASGDPGWPRPRQAGRTDRVRPTLALLIRALLHYFCVGLQINRQAHGNTANFFLENQLSRIFFTECSLRGRCLGCAT